MFAVDNDAPPEDKPDIHVEEIEPDGKLMVAVDGTVMPPLNVCNPVQLLVPESETAFEDNK